VTQPTGLKAHPVAVFKKNGTCISGSSSYHLPALNIGIGRVLGGKILLPGTIVQKDFRIS